MLKTVKGLLVECWKAYTENPTPPVISGPFVISMMPVFQGFAAPAKPAPVTGRNAIKEEDEYFGDIVQLPSQCTDRLARDVPPAADVVFRRGNLIQAAARMTP